MNAILDRSPFGFCRCGRPLQEISAVSWSAPSEVACPVCDMGLTSEEFEEWMAGPPEAPEDPYGIDDIDVGGGF